MLARPSALIFRRLRRFVGAGVAAGDDAAGAAAFFTGGRPRRFGVVVVAEVPVAPRICMAVLRRSRSAIKARTICSVLIEQILHEMI